MGASVKGGYIMTDASFGVSRLPTAGQPINWENANAIEDNLRALILAWPAFESESLLYSVGSFGYLQLDESSSAAPGVEVTAVRHLPRLLVLLDGEGLGNLSWTGSGWHEEDGALCYHMTETTEYNANAALRQLVFSAAGDVDAVVTLAGYDPDWEPDGLRLVGMGLTRLLFRAGATWGLAKAKKHTWGGARPMTWGEAAQLRKE